MPRETECAQGRIGHLKKNIELGAFDCRGCGRSEPPADLPSRNGRGRLLALAHERWRGNQLDKHPSQGGTEKPSPAYIRVSFCDTHAVSTDVEFGVSVDIVKSSISLGGESHQGRTQ